MKKLLSLTLALLCLVSAAPSALAAGLTYELPELNMTINAPEGWYVLTQDVKEGDPGLKTLGMAGQADILAKQFKENGIYLDMINKDYSQIIVAMQNSTGSNINDFNDLTDKELLQFASQMKAIENYVDGQFTVTDCSVYKHKQAKFAVTKYSVKNNGVTIYGSFYVTIKNGQTIVIMMMSKSKISGSLGTTLKSTVDSIVFKKIQPKPVFPAEPATYEFNELNMKIVSPAGWYVSTSDVKDDDPNIGLMGVDKTELADYYKENGIYLFLINSDLNAKIFVDMEDLSDDLGYIDFNYCTDNSLLQTIPGGTEGIVVNSSAVYMHEQTKFTVLSTDDSIIYTTFINGQGISVVLILNKGEVTDSLEQTLKSVVDSIVFTKASSKPGDLKSATYEMPELNMTVNSPEGWFAFTRDVEKDNPDLIFLGADSKKLADQYKENDIYLDMIGEDPYTHILVTMKESDKSRDIYDYNDIADEDLIQMASKAQGAQEQTLSDISVYTHKQAKFVVSSYTNQTEYGKIYLTVINGQTISIGLQSASEIKGSIEQTLQDTVDSIAFTKVTSRPIPTAPDAAAYDLPELNMIMHSPEGWFVFTRDVKEDDPYLKALRINGNGLADYYTDNGIYLDMESADPSAEIFVIKVDSDASRDSKDFNDMADADIISVALQEVIKTERQADLSGCSVYTHKQTKFAVCDFTQTKDDKTVYGKAYFTVINGQTICIMLASRKGEISDSLAQALESTVDGIKLTRVSSTPVDDFIAVYASIAGAAVGAIIGAAIIAIRKRRIAG